jgi:hypothetical protein
MNNIITILLIILAISSILMILATINQYFNKTVGRITRSIMTTWSISLILVAGLGIHYSDKIIKQMKNDPAVKGSFLYVKASSLFENAKGKQNILDAKKALPIAKKALFLETQNKKNVIAKANKTHDQYSKLVTDINNYIKTNKIKNNKK